MRKIFSLRRSVVLAILGLLVALVLPATAASASTPGKLTLCSNGGFDSYAEFPGRGGFSTYIIPAGTCHTTNLGGSVIEQVNVHKGNGAYIGSTIYNGSVGLVIVTISGPSFYAYMP
ncbi:conserved exported hypothetical protein [Frankia canadensis]|uniref:Secreted protein n=1 Tax=Frankia canadensis TaxID=1836972 RepID=A0A2I2KWY8_9ACTN|nr:hypothetical protein [Frankia canadensis]SNQ50181.1 conserved exported hypothetical protein [Frankia canadensis]SOU57471.1 conserved exported hypothetical protein [Frankia canadensis]